MLADFACGGNGDKRTLRRRGPGGRLRCEGRQSRCRADQQVNLSFGGKQLSPEFEKTQGTDNFYIRLFSLELCRKSSKVDFDGKEQSAQLCGFPQFPQSFPQTCGRFCGRHNKRQVEIMGQSAEVHLPTQNRSKIRAVTSSRTRRPVSSPRADRASSTSDSTASGDSPSSSASAARETACRARPAASA